MGNRGKGAKGKRSGKKGSKGTKGGGKPSTKWGDEQAAHDGEEEAPMKKKRRTTQESQDRQRRVKLMELTRAKEKDKRERLSRPNRDASPETAPKSKPKKRKRKRPLRPAGTNREPQCYSSSDEDEQQPAKSVVAAGMTTYKQLLLALEGADKRMSASTEDKDLAAAVVARRMQKEGRDGGYGSESVGDTESGEEDENAEDEDSVGDDEEEDVEGEDGKGERYENGLPKPDDEAAIPESNGTQGLDKDVEEGNTEEADLKAASEADLGADDDEKVDCGRSGTTTANDGAGPAVGGKSKDEFSRHFVSTPVFPAEEAAAMSSAPSGRPSFKPLATGGRKWEAVGLVPAASKNTTIPTPLESNANLTRDLGVLPSLSDGWDACNGGPPTKLQSLLLPTVMGYRDMLYCGWRDDDAEGIRRSYALHALNHALTSQRRVLRHTVRLRKAAEEAKMADTLARDGKDATKNTGLTGISNGSGEANNPALAAVATKTTIDTESEEWQRDQGFTRPKVLILLPLRALAHELVEIMVGLLGPKTVVINKDRFDEEYGPDDDEEDVGEEDEERVERARAVLERKPADWKALLGGGRNVDDMFTIGLAISPGGGKGKPGEGKGVGVRLYCDFYNSDIIIASPVAMHRAAVPTGGEGGDEAGDGVDSDFLSSIEVCILDRADVFLMQNWAYVPEIADIINVRPKGERAARADFSRVRPLFLHDQGRLFRQTLVFSAYQDPNLNALVSRQFRNHDGVVKVWRPSGDGHICEVALQAKQVFQRVPSDSPSTQDDARFDYFVGTVLPQVLRAKQAHTMVFIPSYFDYVRVRNHLLKNKASVVSVHEYSRGSEVARSRARFFRGDRDLLLYTGRAHFFNRYSIRGIHHLIFYSLPEYPQFYPEMVNLLEEAESVAAVTCLSLFTRFERLSLERVVGEARADHMLRSAKNTFLFC